MKESMPITSCFRKEMNPLANFCPNCGSPIEETAKFCTTCGGAIQQQTSPSGNPANAQQAPDSGKGEVRLGLPAPGYSDRVNHPEILAAVKKNRKASKIFLLFLIPIPIIGFLVYSFATGEMEPDKAALYGGIVSGVFLLFAIFSFLRDRSANSYEAVVVEKKSELAYAHRNSGEGERRTEYITTVRTTDGKKKKIVEYEGSQIWAYNYLEPGDRFKYHPQFHFPYERYDKTKAPCLYCVSCGTKNPVEADRCKKCNLPLLK